MGLRPPHHNDSVGKQRALLQWNIFITIGILEWTCVQIPEITEMSKQEQY